MFTCAYLDLYENYAV